MMLPLAAVTIGFISSLIVAEIVLRFLPYNEGLIVPAINDSQPLYHFVPNREFRYSQDWDMKNGRIRRTNNVGFLSDINYVSPPTKPVLAVIGDSFVEAVQVDWKESVHGRLHEKLTPNVDVYAFGAAYASFAQYLAWVRYAHHAFTPDMLVVNVVANDYDLPRVGMGGDEFSAGFRGMAYFAEDATGSLILKRSDRPTDPWWRGLLRRSALVAYLYRNLQVTALPEKLGMLWSVLTEPDGPSHYVANTDARVERERVARAQRHVDRFLDLLPHESGLPPERILIVLDGLRTELYDAAKLAAIQDSFPAVMHRYMAAAGIARGFEVRDLTPLFIERHEKTDDRFEFPFNGHWNANGHDVMATAVLSSRTLARTFPEVKSALVRRQTGAPSP